MPELGLQNADNTDNTRVRLENCIADVRPGMRAAVFIDVGVTAKSAAGVSDPHLGESWQRLRHCRRTSACHVVLDGHDRYHRAR
jgi:hypothetical protein